LSNNLRYALIAATLTLAACSETAPAPQAPPGAMEGFANKQARDEAADKDQKVEAARVREAGRAADARQKVQAAESIDRFERTERALDESDANNRQ
jgi:hypothetical protein